MTSTSEFRFAPTTDDLGIVRIPRTKEAAYRDLYRAFGWQVSRAGGTSRSRDAVSLRLEREPYAIPHARALSALQGSGEDALHTIDELERVQTRTATAVAGGVALLGLLLSSVLAFAAIGAFAVMPTFLVVVALAWWGLGVLIYRLTASVLSGRNADEIDRNYDLIEQVRLRARRLLLNDETIGTR